MPSTATTRTAPGDGAPGAGSPGSGRMTIDQLAERTGMTVRNIRAHQSRGLLPAPEVVGRTGYYGEGHVARIELIKEMQSEGLNLEAIRRVLEGYGESSVEVLDFTRALRAPYEDETPEILDAREVAEPWGEEGTREEVMARAEKLGLLRPLGDGRIEVLSPRLLAAGTELAQLGIPVSVALDTLAQLRERSEAIATTFMELFQEQIWEPFDRAGRPEEQWPEVRDALERLRPLASSAFLAAFRFAMEEVTEQALGRAIRREVERADGRR